MINTTQQSKNLLNTRMVGIDGFGAFVVGLDTVAYRVSVERLPFGYWVKSITYGSIDLNVNLSRSMPLFRNSRSR